MSSHYIGVAMLTFAFVGIIFGLAKTLGSLKYALIVLGLSAAATVFIYTAAFLAFGG